MAKVKGALIAALGVVLALIVAKALFGAFMDDPAGAAHKVKDGWNFGAKIADSLQIFISEGGWIAVLALIAFVVFILRMIRR